MIKHIVTSFGDVKFAQQERKQCLLGTEHSLLKVSENIGCNRFIKKQLFIFHFRSIRLKPSALGAISFEEFLYDLL